MITTNMLKIQGHPVGIFTEEPPTPSFPYSTAEWNGLLWMTTDLMEPFTNCEIKDVTVNGVTYNDVHFYDYTTINSLITQFQSQYPGWRLATTAEISGLISGHTFNEMQAVLNFIPFGDSTGWGTGSYYYGYYANGEFSIDVNAGTVTTYGTPGSWKDVCRLVKDIT